MQNTPSQQYPSPALGQQMPGMNSDMPAQGGLTALANPVAQQLQSHGRNGDTMLVHMTPEEVGGLQQLALAHGGSLTINPHTGLPEANFLKKLLPTLLGAVLAPFTGGLSAALLVGAGYTAATGSLKKGLMAGLGAFGGAGIGSAVANIGAKSLTLAGSAIPSSVPGLVTTNAALGAGSTAGQMAAGAAGAGAAGAGAAGAGAAGAGAAGAGAAGQLAQSVPTAVGTHAGRLASGFSGEAAKGIGQTARAALTNTEAGLSHLGSQAMRNPLEAAKTFGGEFANAARGSAAPGSMMYKYAPLAASSGVIGTLSDVMEPGTENFSLPEEKSTYEGPYVPTPRNVSFQTLTGDPSQDSREHLYFDPVNPYPSYVPAKSLSIKDKNKGYAEGGSASAPKTSGLEALIERYASKNPGAIKASVNYAPPEKKTTVAPATPATTATPAVTATPAATYTGDPTSVSTLTAAPNIDDYVKTVLGGTAPARTTADGIDLTQLMRDRPDVYNAFFNEYNNPKANDKNSTAWQKRVGGSDPYAYANYWYNTHGKNEGYGQPRTGAPTPTMDIEPGAPRVGRYGEYTPGGGGGRDSDNIQFVAGGGHINMGNGSFVVDARTVSELGNGSSSAGIDMLSRMGGQPVRGPGDGVSDSVPAKIGGRQAARVARDEVIFPPQAVNRIGKGSNKRGADKLYAMMDRAHKARKKADRGEDTKLRRGLA